MLYPMNGGGSGDLVETVLWTNPNPGANTFTNQVVTLSDNIANYDYIKFNYGYAYNQYTNESDKSSSVIPVSDFLKSGTSPYGFRGSNLVAHRSNGYAYVRTLIYNDVNKIQITDCIQFSSSGSTGISNIFVTPITITGLTKTGGGGTVDPPALVSTTLWTNSSPTTQYSSATVELNDDIDNYDYLKFEWCLNTNNTSKKVSTLVSVDDFKTMDANTTVSNFLAFGARETSSNRYVRPIFYIDDTHVEIWGCALYNAISGSYPTACIPQKIEGLKKTSDFSYNDPKVVDTHNITSGQTYTFTLDASKEYILSAYSTGAGTNVLYVKNGTYKALVASGSMGSISSITTTSITVYGYAIGGATITWTLTQLN